MVLSPLDRTHMNLVYFDRQLSDQAPSLIGAFCVDPGANWVTFTAIIEALDQGREVNIRPASPDERGRVEAIIALNSIADQLAAKIGGLLDVSEDASGVANGS